jgi:hypothetical protein
MRKVVICTLLSVDGVAEHPNDYVLNWDEEMDANLGAVIASQDTVLLGRRTYDNWAGYWPTAEHEPFAGFINNVPKHVVTWSTSCAWSSRRRWRAPGASSSRRTARSVDCRCSSSAAPHRAPCWPTTLCGDDPARRLRQAGGVAERRWVSIFWARPLTPSWTVRR